MANVKVYLNRCVMSGGYFHSNFIDIMLKHDLIINIDEFDNAYHTIPSKITLKLKTECEKIVEIRELRRSIYYDFQRIVKFNEENKRERKYFFEFFKIKNPQIHAQGLLTKLERQHGRVYDISDIKISSEDLKILTKCYEIRNREQLTEIYYNEKALYMICSEHYIRN